MSELKLTQIIRCVNEQNEFISTKLENRIYKHLTTRLIKVQFFLYIQLLRVLGIQFWDELLSSFREFVLSIGCRGK